MSLFELWMYFSEVAGLCYVFKKYITKFMAQSIFSTHVSSLKTLYFFINLILYSQVTKEEQ